jgi:hypothetical protein
MSRQVAIGELAALAEDQMGGTSRWPEFERFIAAVRLPRAVVTFQETVADMAGKTVAELTEGPTGWMLMIAQVFIPGTGWRALGLDESVEFSADVARGLKIMGANAVMITFGPATADFMLTELV